MTAAEIEIAIAFNRVTFLPATWDKRFPKQWSNQAGHEKATGQTYTLTDSQSEWLYRLLYKYRRQIPDVYEKYKDHPQCCQKIKL